MMLRRRHKKHENAPQNAPKADQKPQVVAENGTKPKGTRKRGASDDNG